MSGSEKTVALDRQAAQAILISTFIVGVAAISSMVSYATLIFADTCPDFLGAGIALFFLAGCIIPIIFAMFSYYPGTYGSIQDIPVAISAVMAVSLVEMLPGAGQKIIFSNVFVAIAISTILTGICFVFLGYFRLGNLVRFIPYPVMGGFLAGTGWLLVKGGLQVSTSVSFRLADVFHFLNNVNMLQLACGLIFGGGILFLKRRFPSNKFILPASIISSFLVFTFTAKLMGYSSDNLSRGGWLVGPLPEAALWRSMEFPDLKLVEWSLIIKQIGSISSIIVLSVISFLLNESGVELVVGGDFEINRDLKVTGGANMATGFLGVPSSYIYLGSTVTASRIGGRHRSLGVLIGVLLLMVFFAGASFLSLFPKFVAGGLLLFLGLSLMSEWLIDALKTIPVIDFTIICSIVLIIEFVGFLEGIGIGILASIIIFVFRYSTINVIKNRFDGSTLNSSKDRSIPDQRILEHNAERMLILQLDGFIFFGTGNGLYESVKQNVTEPGRNLRFILMDMTLVRGIDSSAIKSFQKLAQLLVKSQIELLIVNLDDNILKILDTGGFTPNEYKCLQYFKDLDHAIEHCEDIIIESEKSRMREERLKEGQTDIDIIQSTYTDMLAALELQEIFENMISKMMPYLKRVPIKTGDHLYRQKDICKDVFFIMRGQVTLSRKNRRGESTRIRTLGPWTITGELGAFTDYRAPYDALVVKDGHAFKLDEKSKLQLETDNPELASELHKLIITMLGNQLMKTSHMIGNIKLA
jgi:SulP family sulfate permease